jgi:hypothetical protein
MFWQREMCSCSSYLLLTRFAKASAFLTVSCILATLAAMAALTTLASCTSIGVQRLVANLKLICNP